MRFTEVKLPVPSMRGWWATHGGYSFCITLEQERNGWEGYTASWKSTKHDTRPFGAQPANRIDGRWETFAGAEAACRATYRQLRDKN